MGSIPVAVTERPGISPDRFFVFNVQRIKRSPRDGSLSVATLAKLWIWLKFHPAGLVALFDYRLLHQIVESCVQTFTYDYKLLKSLFKVKVFQLCSDDAKQTAY